MLARYKHLTEVLLPARAAEEHWPIHFDHCFKRICLDSAFQDCWYKHLQKPAERHITEEPLSNATAAAERILEQGRPELDRLNQLSLKYRGKLKSR